MEKQEWLAGTTRERIQDLAKNRKVTQVMLAEATGINRSKLSRFFSGASDSLSHEDIVKIAHFFRVSTDFLLGETNEPDRKNYDIEELGLTVKAAKRLYTGIVNSEIVCQLLEHDKCGELMSRIELYWEGINSAGIAAKNQVYESLRESLPEHVKNNPEDKKAAIKMSQTLKAMMQPTQASELDGISQMFIQMLKDIHKNDTESEQTAKRATKDAMTEMMNATIKGAEGFDLRQALPGVIMDKILTDLPEQMSIALMKAPEELKPEAERVMQRLRDDIKDYLILVSQAQQRQTNDK